jgi:molybdopterin converting factor small subunit
MKIRVVISGRGYDRLQSLPEELELADAATTKEAVESLCRALPDGTQLPPGCLVALSGQHLGLLFAHEPRPLRDGDELVIVAPVAGG